LERLCDRSVCPSAIEFSGTLISGAGISGSSSDEERLVGEGNLDETADLVGTAFSD